MKALIVLLLLIPIIVFYFMIYNFMIYNCNLPELSKLSSGIYNPKQLLAFPILIVEHALIGLIVIHFVARRKKGFGNLKRFGDFGPINILEPGLITMLIIGPVMGLIIGLVLGSCENLLVYYSFGGLFFGSVGGLATGLVGEFE